MATIELHLIDDSSHAIRSAWDEDALDELVQSIEEQGVIVPVKLRVVADRYEIVYGHRRVEAARRAGLTVIPAIIEGLDDADAMVQALIENLQREDLGPMDLARALQALKETTGWSNKEIGRQGIISRSYTGRLLALLDEPREIQDRLRGVAQGYPLTEGHVRLARQAGTTPEERVAVIEKAADEELTRKQTRCVAESVVAAQSALRKQYLLEEPYSPHTHDPDDVRKREEKYGDHDPLLRDGPPDPPKDEAWRQLPSVKEAIDMTKAWERELETLRQMADLGKMSPEARQFVAHRLSGFIEELQRWVEGLQNES